MEPKPPATETTPDEVLVPEGARLRLEKLCRYAARPPVAEERLRLLPDGNVVYRLKKRRRDGSTHVVLEPLALIERLCAHRGRTEVVEAAAAEQESADGGSAAMRGKQAPHAPRKLRIPRSRYSWAELMRRVFPAGGAGVSFVPRQKARAGRDLRGGCDTEDLDAPRAAV